jgi:type II secretory pathway pseudopilin PulG
MGFWQIFKCAGRVRNRAFTAIEMVGALSIMALLAAAIIPSIIRKIDIATIQRETSDLSVMGNGLVREILNDKQFPATNGLTTAIATYLNMSVNQVATNPRGFSRMFMVDPNLKIAGAGLPYVQLNTGSVTAPTNARVLILSTIAQPAVSTISDSFANIWNTPQGGKPSTWTGKQDDLCIQRVELGGLFHKIYFINIDPTNYGYFTFETNAQSYIINSGGQYTTYVLDGTALSLYASGLLQVREILHDDQSYIYENNAWSRSFSSEQLTTTLDQGSFGWWVARFLSDSSTPSPKFAATQQSVTDEMYTYLAGYALWAAGNPTATPVIPPFQGSGVSSGVQYPYLQVLQSSQTRLAGFSYNLGH